MYFFVWGVAHLVVMLYSSWEVVFSGHDVAFGCNVIFQVVFSGHDVAFSDVTLSCRVVVFSIPTTVC